MIVIVGGGPAGRLASMHLASENADVLLIDKRRELGGQCLHKGCMVICGLNDIARSLDECSNLRQLGAFKNIPEADYSLIVQNLKQTQKKIAEVLEKETRDYGVDITYGEAAINGKDIILEGESLNPDTLIIATGSVPSVPAFEGREFEGVYTPHTITEIKTLPERIVIVGGGVVAAEYAYIFSFLGVETEIISRSSFLRDKPKQLVKSAKKELENVIIREFSTVRRITGENRVSGIEIIQNGEVVKIPADTILVATGLKPNSKMVSGIKKGEQGEIIVNERMHTDIPGVYAAGDVTGPPFLTPVARYEGIIAADDILGRKVRSMPVRIPQSIKLRYEHSFFDTGGEKTTNFSLPAPAGPGSFWYVHDGHTGRAMISKEADNDNITGIYLGSPGSGSALASIAHRLSEESKNPDYSGFLEIHPSTDGTPYLIRYINELNKK